MTEHERYEIDLMRHALAWPKNFRNHFCAEPGSLDDEVWRGLVSQGQAEMYRTDEDSGMRFYQVTERGIARIKEHAAAGATP